MSTPKNKVEFRPLTEDEDGGWLASFPDLPCSMSDGESQEETLRNTAKTESAWLAANENKDKSKAEEPARVQKKVNEEGVSLDTMMVTFIAHGLVDIFSNRHSRNK